MQSNAINLRQGYKQLALSRRWQKPLAVTLTLKQGVEIGTGIFEPITREKAAECVCYAMNELARRCYPKMKGKRTGEIARFAVVEGGGSGKRLHYHLLIDCPPHLDAATFKCLIREVWHKSKWGYREIDVRSADPGWLDYILKTQGTAENSQCVDLKNCRGMGSIAYK